MRRSILAALVVVSFFAGTVYAVGEAIVPITWRSPASSFALDPQRSAVAIAMPDLKDVALYPHLFYGNPEESIPAGLNEVCTDVVYVPTADGNGMFAALCPTSHTIKFLDASTFKVVGSLTLRNSRPTSLVAAPLTDDPKKFLIYYAALSTNMSDASCEFGRIDPATKTELSPLDLQGVRMNFESFAISPDGQYLYPAKRNGNSPLYVFRIASHGDQASAELTTTKQTDGFSTYLLDPAGAFLATSQFVFSSDLKTQIADLKELPIGFLHDHPILLAQKASNKLQLAVYSTNDFSHLADIDLPPLVPQGRNQRDFSSLVSQINLNGQTVTIFPALLTDAKPDGRAEKMAVICMSRGAYIMPVQSLSDRDEPNLAVRVRGRTDLETGKPATFDLQPLAENAVIQLGAAPASAKLAGGKITYTPDASEIGDQTIEIKVSSPKNPDTAPRLQKLTVNVRRDGIDLRRSPGRIAFTPDGKKIVTFYSGDNDPNRGFPRGQNPSTSLVQVIDVASGKIVTRQEFEGGLYGNDVAADDTRIALPIRDADAIDLFPIADLTHPQRLFVNGRAQRLCMPGNGKVYVAANTGVSIYDLKTLKPLLEPKPQNGYSSDRNSQVPELTDGGWYFDGVVYDAALAKPLLFVQPRDFLFTPQNPNLRLEAGAAAVQPFDTRLSGAQFVRGGQQIAGQINISGQQQFVQNGVNDGRGLVVLPDHPLAVGLMMSVEQIAGTPPSQIETHKLLLFEIDTAKLVGEIPLVIQTPNRGLANDLQHAIVEYRAGKLFVIAGTRLYIVPIENLLAATNGAKFVTPIHFEHKQDVLVADTAKPTTIKCVATGGQGKPTYRLATPAQGLDLNEQTGDLTIDFGQLVATGSSLLGNAMTGTDVNARFQDRVDQARDSFQNLVGKPAKGIPFALRIDVIAVDERQQKTMLPRVVLVDFPQATFDKIVADAKKDAQAGGATPRAMAGGLDLPARDKINLLYGKIYALERALSELREENARLKGENQVLRENAKPAK